MEKDMAEQRNGFYAVNWGVSKNRVDINETSIDIALQKNETSSLADNLVKLNQGMSKNQATMKEISEGRVLQQKRISSLSEEVFQINQDLAAQKNETSLLTEA